MNEKIRNFYFLCVVQFLSLTGSVAQSAYTASALKLYTGLTPGYNANIRPDSTVPVSVSFQLGTINHLDTSTEQFSVTGRFTLSWSDTRYLWDPSSFDNVEYLFLTKDICWRPQVAIHNSVNEHTTLNDAEEDIRMRVKSDGTVLWEPGGAFIVKCAVDITNFPFDRQECTLSLHSLAYDDTEVLLSHYTETVKLDGIENNAEWKVVDTSTNTEMLLDGRDALSKTLLRFTVQLERKYKFYVWTLLVPYILLSALGLVVFLLPHTNGEKITFLTTIICLVAVYFVIFSTFIALPAGTFPTIGILFFLLLLLNMLELFMTVIVERFNRHESDEMSVTQIAQSRGYAFLAKLACYHTGNKTAEPDYNCSTKRKTSSRLSMPKNTRVSPSSLQSVSPLAMRPKNPIEFDRIKSAASTRTVASDFTISTEVSNSSSTLPLEYKVPVYGWKDIARMLDRISLAVSLFLVLGLNVVFIAILHASMK